MNLGFRLIQEPRLLIEAPYLGSIFPAVDKLLGETDYQKALQFVGQKKDMKRYFSMVDFLFCEIFIEHRRACQKFYRGKGPQLKDIISEEQRAEFERVLLKALEVATIKYQKREYIYWARFRTEVLKASA